jgi:hypothetical protein
MIGTEAILEILLAVAMNNDIIVLHDKNEYSTYVTELRQWVIIMEVAVYVFGLIMYLFRYFIRYPTRKPTRRQQQPEWWDREMDDTFQNMMQQTRQQHDLPIQNFALSPQRMAASFPRQMTRKHVSAAGFGIKMPQCPVPPSNQQSVVERNMCHLVPSPQQSHSNHESWRNHPNCLPQMSCTSNDSHQHDTTIMPSKSGGHSHVLVQENFQHVVAVDGITVIPPSTQTEQNFPPIDSIENMVTEDENMILQVETDNTVAKSSPRKRSAIDQCIDTDENGLQHHTKRQTVHRTEPATIQ